MATHFTVAEVRKLAKVFARFCGTANYITKRPFVKILKNHMPGIVADATLVDRVFAVSDPVRVTVCAVSAVCAACAVLTPDLHAGW